MKPGRGNSAENDPGTGSGNSTWNGAGEVRHLPKPLPCWCTWCLLGTTG